MKRSHKARMSRSMSSVAQRTMRGCHLLPSILFSFKGDPKRLDVHTEAVCSRSAAHQAVHHVAQLRRGVVRGVRRLYAAVGVGAVRLHAAVVVRHRRERRGLGPVIAEQCCRSVVGRIAPECAPESWLLLGTCVVVAQWYPWHLGMPRMFETGDEGECICRTSSPAGGHGQHVTERVLDLIIAQILTIFEFRRQPRLHVHRTDAEMSELSA
jgi:hypothetical protein